MCVEGSILNVYNKFLSIFLPAAAPVSPEVLEQELRLKIKAEMQTSLEEEISQRRQELQRQ